MARCEELEAILQAQFALEYADPDALDERLRRLNFLVDQVVAGTALTRHDLLSALRDRYQEDKRAQLLAQARRNPCEPQKPQLNDRKEHQERKAGNLGKGLPSPARCWDPFPEQPASLCVLCVLCG